MPLSLPPESATAFEFHLSRLARERYSFDRDLLRRVDDVLHPDEAAVDDLNYRMNVRLGPLGRGAKPGHLAALVLLQYLLHIMIELYRKDREPRTLKLADDWLNRHFDEEPSAAILQSFSGHYTPLDIFHSRIPLLDYLNREQHQVTGREQTIERMLLVYLANVNPAAASLRDLYDDRELPVREEYLKRIASLEQFFAQLPVFGSRNQSLFEMLYAPIKASPESLLGQLDFIRNEWSDLIGPELLRTLLTAQDRVREEEKSWKPVFGQGPDIAYLKALAGKSMFAGSASEPERFSHDTDWMPRVVIFAKSVYVWLDQLSKRYNRPIRRLDEVPNEELDRLASWGFTGLWLIGLWERSGASKIIKHVRGNTDAVASAYSIYDYQISGDLGGNAGAENLKQRAAERGIRLASDLVPNHMGIDSVWMRQHPDWFIGLDHAPYSAYRYTGPDLSGDPHLDIRIEDGYWNQTDAAVVLRRIDRNTGSTRYIYHGNDGTSMPWNDTAQLNFMIPDVREAVIRLIVDVAKRFPILRFDAAMTLAKKHYQRLWFPEPGTGGAIPSRAQFGMTKEEFDRQMPAEFWREVVDRVAAEAPDTLLLAEAFWLLEGFFVRTLGMHRVYNSAFMNMLKLEENAKYRTVIKNLLEFDPRILQRFVNFMNNPDEDTAVAQFGKGDKYFGVCLMMITMPGTPMVGHGQIEGLTERYGHEYQRAYYDETPDEQLVARHEREIFPFMRQRYLFSGAEHFLLYDVYRESGEVDENVFAYSNGYGDARSLVVFHNRYAETGGWIHTSVAYSVPDSHGGRYLIRKSLAEGLGLNGQPGVFYVAKDRITGLEYLRRGSDIVERGLQIHLRAYQYQVFTEFREIRDDADGHWAQLEAMLGGRGVPSLDREYKKVYLAPLINSFEEFASAPNFRDLLDLHTAKTLELPPVTELLSREAIPAAKPDRAIPSDRENSAAFAEKARPFLMQAALLEDSHPDFDATIRKIETTAYAVLKLCAWDKHITFDRTKQVKDVRDHLIRVLPEKRGTDRSQWRVLAGWLAVWTTGCLEDAPDSDAKNARRLDDWLLSETLNHTFRELGSSESEAWYEVELIRSLLASHRVAASFSERRRFAGFAEALRDSSVQRLLGCHPYGGVVWFHRESFENYLQWLFRMTALGYMCDPSLSRAERGRRLAADFACFRQIEELSVISEYQIERLILLLGYAARSAEKPAESPKPKSS
jgi:glycosidase